MNITIGMVCILLGFELTMVAAVPPELPTKIPFESKGNELVALLCERNVDECEMLSSVESLVGDQFLDYNQYLEEYCDNQRLSPLHCAVSRKKPAVLEFLLSKTCKWLLDVRDSSGMTPLWYAVSDSHDNEESVRLLVSAHANVHHRNVENRSILLEALKGGSQTILKYLVEGGADLRDLDLALLFGYVKKGCIQEKNIVYLQDCLNNKYTISNYLHYKWFRGQLLSKT